MRNASVYFGPGCNNGMQKQQNKRKSKNIKKAKENLKKKEKLKISKN
jgi:hypothetical protein